MTRIARPGKRHDPPGPQHEFARVGQHGSPFRQRRLRAEAEKAERRRVEDRGRNAERRLHDQWRRAIRQHLLEHQPEPAGAGDLGGRDIILRDFGDHGGARDPHIMRQQHDGDRDHRIHQAGAEDRNDHDREQQARQRQNNVHQPHDRDLDHATEKTGDQAEDRADDDRERDHRDADQERKPRAVNEAGKHIAADRVGAERIGERSALLPERRLEEGRVVGEDRRMRRDEIGNEREQNQNDNDEETRHRAVIGLEMGPEFQQRMRRRGCETTGGVRTSRSSGVPDARVDQAVSQIDQQIDRHHDRADQQRAALQHRIIAAVDALDQPFADARPGENRFGQDRAGEQHADLQADHGHHRDQRIAQAMDGDHAETRQSLARAVRI